jgi:DNA adenine methylase
VRRDRKPFVMDEKLTALRRQIGEVAWSDRVARAKERETLVLNFQAGVANGLTPSQAFREIGTDVTLSTIRSWAQRHAAHGLGGLIDRTGVLTTLGFQDPLPSPVRKHVKTREALSFVKWVGSKQGVLTELLRRRPPGFTRYFEPMVGSGVLFLGLKPRAAVLGDANPELMLCYEVIRDQVDALLQVLREHRNTAEHYHAVRAQAPEVLSQIERAARFIFLNKTCFNGLYRVNRRGRFNVPYGRNLWANFTDEGVLRRVSQCLKGAELRGGDFADICADAAEGDFVYFDPPYITRRAARIIRYQPGSFYEADHRRLARYVRELDMRGCFVMVSNSEHPLVLKLYQGFRIDSLDVRRKVNADATARGGWRELLIRNFDPRGNLLTRRRMRTPQLSLPWS